MKTGFNALTKVSPLNFDIVRAALLLLLVFQVCYGFCQDIKFADIAEGKPLKRSKEYHMYWAGRLTSQIVSVQFLKNDLVVHEGPGFLKSGTYQILLPSNLIGKYTIKVLDPSTQSVLQSDQVEIKRRIPLVAQLGIAIGIAVMISFMTT